MTTIKRDMLKGIAGAAALAALLVAGGCREEKKEAPRSVAAAPAQEEVKQVKPSSDEVLHELTGGGVASIVTERYPGRKSKSPEYIDSVWFDASGRLGGHREWWVDNWRRTPGEYVVLTYDADGAFLRGEEKSASPVLRVDLQRNKEGEIVKLETGAGDTDRGGVGSWEWSDGLPRHYSNVSLDGEYSESYKYAPGEIERAGCLSKTTDEEGTASEVVEYKVTERDDAGNWTEREVTTERKIFEYDYETGRVVEVGKPVREQSVERRRITYRR